MLSGKFVTQINGEPTSAEELAALAFRGFAHFTAMQVRGGRVRGLDLHLERLRSASLTFFGRAMPDDAVRQHLRKAIGREGLDLSLVAVMFSRNGEFVTDTAPNDPAILVRTSAPSNGPTGPLKLAAYEHERWCPSIKQTGEAAKTVLLRRAVDEGCDDAVLLDRAGRLSEGSIWNLAFWDGTTVYWPEAEMLLGTTMSIVRRQLDKLGVAQRVAPITLASLRGMGGCVVMNSWTPGIPVSAIGATHLPVDQSFIATLHRAFYAEAEVCV